MRLLQDLTTVVAPWQLLNFHSYMGLLHPACVFMTVRFPLVCAKCSHPLTRCG